MEMKKPYWLAAIVLCSLLAFSSGYAIQNGVLNKQHGVTASTANVYLTIENDMGVYDLPVGNVITDIGENYVRDILGFDNVTSNNATKWITLSNDATPVQTWTKLANEATASGSGRALGTVTAWISGTDYAYNVTNKFTFTGDITLQCAGLQWSGVASSDSNLFACAAFTQTAFANTWNLTITWSIVIDAN